jgi:hypothetical protein
MRIRLQRTKQIPKALEPAILYVSEEFQFAAHLCACGCGSKIKTPLGPTEWEFTDSKAGPTLYPSIGNWQQKCLSHYWIRNGEVKWAPKWSPEEIAKGRRREETRRQAYYDDLYKETSISRSRRIWKRIKNLFC